MQLLREFYELCEGGICKDLLTEEEKKFVSSGGMILSGILQQADAINGNGRTYPFDTLSREVQKYKQIVKERRALGELDHPDDSVINLKNASHLVTEIWMDGKKVMGKLRVLNTPSGNTLRALVENGVKLGISSRALGSVNEANGRTVVQEDLQLICFDIVSEPSTPNAFLSKDDGGLRESKTSNKIDKINSLLKEVLTNE